MSMETKLQIYFDEIRYLLILFFYRRDFHGSYG